MVGQTHTAKLNLRHSERKIVEALKERSMTFKELEETKMSKSIISLALRNLERRKIVERKLVRREDKVGRQRSYKVLVQLTQKFQSAKMQSLLNLNNISPLVQLDLEKGKELLTPSVIETILEIASLNRREGKWLDWKERREMDKQPLIEFYGSDEKIPENLKQNYEKSTLEFTEYFLLMALGRYNFDRGFISIENSEWFPAIARVRKAGVLKEFNELLDWIKPLIEGKNIAAHVYTQDWLDYSLEVSRVWRERGSKEVIPLKPPEKLLSPFNPSKKEEKKFNKAPQSRGEKEKEKGGEKA